MKEDLKPCPFCGFIAPELLTPDDKFPLRTIDNRYKDVVIVSCPSCGLIGYISRPLLGELTYYHAKERVIKAWNTRKRPKGDYYGKK